MEDEDERLESYMKEKGSLEFLRILGKGDEGWNTEVGKKRQWQNIYEKMEIVDRVEEWRVYQKDKTKFFK